MTAEKRSEADGSVREPDAKGYWGFGMNYEGAGFRCPECGNVSTYLTCPECDYYMEGPDSVHYRGSK